MILQQHRSQQLAVAVSKGIQIQFLKGHPNPILSHIPQTVLSHISLDGHLCVVCSFGTQNWVVARKIETGRSEGPNPSCHSQTHFDLASKVLRVWSCAPLSVLAGRHRADMAGRHPGSARSMNTIVVTI